MAAALADCSTHNEAWSRKRINGDVTAGVKGCQSDVFAERKEPKDSLQREPRSPSISLGICDCQRSDKMPPGAVLGARAGRDLTLH
ncbi:Hypothetical protein SMAX5B_018802 [Scophthalmus maximus]|uniref:Uncharacterized protein n=1 Tax=Scophthalmus maximus TaxID=52904 RepID=A0A2U9BQT4_SCOMX|nr:Hypothetical protein SMAX5B_018802 [Scophthalmus maximus]